MGNGGARRVPAVYGCLRRTNRFAHGVTLNAEGWWAPGAWSFFVPTEMVVYTWRCDLIKMGRHLEDILAFAGLTD